MDSPKFKDPYQAEHDEVKKIYGSLISKEEPNKDDTISSENKKEQPKAGTMLSNDDSLTNITPAVEVKEERNKDIQVDLDEYSFQTKVKANVEQKKVSEEHKKAKKEDIIPPGSVSNVTHDLDKVIKDILEEEGLKPCEMMYDPKNIHVMNQEFVDEYVDDDDPGFDTFVVQEENFVASCKELAKLNDFPKRAIQPDTKHDMA